VGKHLVQQAFGHRNPLFRPQAEQHGCGVRAREGPSIRSSFFCVAHDLWKPTPFVRKTVPICGSCRFSAHDPVENRYPLFGYPSCPSVQDRDQREQRGRFRNRPASFFSAALQGARAFVVNAAAAHVDGLDLVGRGGADRLIVLSQIMK